MEKTARLPDATHAIGASTERPQTGLQDGDLWSPTMGAGSFGTVAHRRSLPDAVVAFRLSGVVQQALHDALKTSLPLFLAEDLDACCRRLECYKSPALLIQFLPTNVPRTLNALYQIRRQFPLTLTTGVIADTTSNASAATRFYGIGPLPVIPTGIVSQTAFVHAALARSQTETLVQTIWRLTSLTVADSVATILRPAVLLAHAPIPLPKLASIARLHERSLRKYCQIHGLPSPQWIVGWARMLVVAYYLEETGRSVQSIARLLGFSSSSQLGNHVHRYTGMSCSALRGATPLVTVSRRLELALTPYHVNE